MFYVLTITLFLLYHQHVPVAGSRLSGSSCRSLVSDAGDVACPSWIQPLMNAYAVVIESHMYKENTSVVRLKALLLRIAGGLQSSF